MRRALALALCAAAACKSNPAPVSTPDAAVVCDQTTPCALTPGTPLTGTIATAGQVDGYTIDVPASAARTIIQLQLSDTAPVTPLRLVYILTYPDGTNVSRGPVHGTGPQALTGNFLANGPGTYKVIVRDVLSQAVDSKFPYTIQASLLSDPDAAFEPDDTLDKARPIAFGSAVATMSGHVTHQGDLDLMTFSVSSPGAIAHFTAAQPALANSPLKLRVRLLQLLTPTDLGTASNLVEVNSSAAGAGLTVDKTRFLQPGSYAIALDDATGQGGDVSDGAKYTVTLQQLTEPDPNEQTARNDTPASATALPANGSAIQGAIGSQGDRDWYLLTGLTSKPTAQIVEVKVDPATVNQDVELNWVVGELFSNPSAPCDFNCGPTVLCSAESDGGSVCGIDMHGWHHFAHGETAPEVVRMRFVGTPPSFYVAMYDQGDQRFTSKLYSVSARVFDDPDSNDFNGPNDTINAATDAGAPSSPGSATYSVNGMISTWNYIDNQTVFEVAPTADHDWYSLHLPPRDTANGFTPDSGCPGPDAFDGGVNGDAGYYLDGGDGTCALPRQDYGLVARWHGPRDGVYRIGLQLKVLDDAGTARCLADFDDSQGAGHANAASDNDGGFILGTGAGTNEACFCLPKRYAEHDQIWLDAIAAAHAAPPTQNAYSDNPYSITLEVHPGVLSPACDAGCTLNAAPQCPNP